MKIVEEKENQTFSLPTQELSIEALSVLQSPLAQKILKTLSKTSMYPKQLAKELKVHEQNVYYHIKRLEKTNCIKVIKEEMINGTKAQIYSVASPSFVLKFSDFEESPKSIQKKSSYLSPFITENGELDALIVVGSPDPHGPQKARSRDGYFGMDFALFLGSFLSYIPKSRVRLDTEITKEELKQNNLIVIGGPIVNRVTNEINNELPIYFDEEKRCLTSKISKKEYYSEETGCVNKINSPFNKEKSILTLLGLRNQGTKAVMLAFLKEFSQLKRGNIYNQKIQSRVIEGIDFDSDGEVDSIEFLE